jgi:hypothetical protein
MINQDRMIKPRMSKPRDGETEWEHGETKWEIKWEHGEIKWEHGGAEINIQY